MLKIILEIQTLKHFPSYNERYVKSSNSFIPCDISVHTDTTAFIASAINPDHEYIFHRDRKCLLCLIHTFWAVTKIEYLLLPFLFSI